MARPVTLFLGQWADLDTDTAFGKAKDFGYDGVELPCWGEFLDVEQAASNMAYCKERKAKLAQYGLGNWAISAHLVGQAVCDPIDERHKSIVPPRVWGDGEPEGVRRRAAAELIKSAQAAVNLGVTTVNGFTGSPIWHKLYFFPPTSDADVDAGYQEFADRFGPILDEYQKLGVKFALEVHPTEIAYDIYTTERAIKAVNGHPCFGINFDPSHLRWQLINPVKLIDAFPDRIFHVHIKDAIVTLDGSNSILSSHINFGDHRRGWDFRSPGHGDVNFEEIIRALNRINYQGPLSVEWEDSGMDRDHGGREAAAFVRKIDFAASNIAFDAQFDR
jgi:sugar phosphate isomerase/epimerase